MIKKVTYILIIILTAMSFLTATSFTHFTATNNVDSRIVERGRNYVIRRLNSTTFVWTSALPWIWNSNKYVPYIFKDNYDDGGYFLMRNGHITVKLFDNYAEFWDVNYTEIRVKEERWLAQYYDTEWITLDTYKPKLYAITNSSGIFITQSWSIGPPINSDDAFQVTYALREGIPLEHFVALTNNGNIPYEFRLIQTWDGIAANKVKCSEGEVRVMTSTNINSLWFQFISDTNDFVVFENLLSTGYYDEEYVYHNDVLQPTTFSIDTKGMSASFTYSNHNKYTLNHGESIQLDPSTTVNQEYSRTGLIELDRPYEWPPYSGKAWPGHGIEIGKQVDEPVTHYYLQRGYVSFDTSSIDEEDEIDSVTLELWLYYVDIDICGGQYIDVYSGKNKWTTLEDNDWGNCTTYEDYMFIYDSTPTGTKTFDVDESSVNRGDGTRRTQFEIMLWDEVTAPEDDYNEFRIAFQNPYSGGHPANLTVYWTEK